MKEDKHFFELIDKEVRPIEEDLSLADFSIPELPEDIKELNFDRT